MKTTAELLLPIAERLMRSPAAPYHEQATANTVRQICAEYELPVQADRFGNLLVHLDRAPAQRPFTLAAHLDHPGFVIERQLGSDRWQARFLGGVGDAFFKPGVPLRLYPDGIKTRLGKRLSKKERHFEISASGAGEPKFAVWDLQEFQFSKGLITGRVCDDLIGVAAILAILIQLRRAKVNVLGIFSRAEEVGFHGALALAGSGLIPKNALIVSLETSRELPPVKIGSGVILRVGDRASVFDPLASRYLAEAAADLQKSRKDFQFQRALMFGGTCEATAYQDHGYSCAAVCVALGNYHNCGAHDRIRPEFVSASDAVAMTDLLVQAAKSMPRFDALTSRLPKRLAKLRSAALKQLPKSPLATA